MLRQTHPAIHYSTTRETFTVEVTAKLDYPYILGHWGADPERGVVVLRFPRERSRSGNFSGGGRDWLPDGYA